MRARCTIFLRVTRRLQSGGVRECQSTTPAEEHAEQRQRQGYPGHRAQGAHAATRLFAAADKPAARNCKVRGVALAAGEATEYRVMSSPSDVTLRTSLILQP
jgi:hypothetical protein